MTTHHADPYARLGPRPTPVADYTSERTYESTRLPVDRATTLIPDAYTTREFFDLERERVFASSWVAVACTSDVDRPGRVVVVDVAGRSVIVTRNREGALRAFHNVCRHRATKLLTDGQERLKRIRCPYHSWTYDLDGRCLGTPLFGPSRRIRHRGTHRCRWSAGASRRRLPPATPLWSSPPSRPRSPR